MSGKYGIIWTIGLVFVVTVAAAFLNAGGDLFHMSASSYQTIINAGVAAVLAFVINYLTPMVTRYGVGSK